MAQKVQNIKVCLYMCPPWPSHHEGPLLMSVKGTQTRVVTGESCIAAIRMNGITFYRAGADTH